MDYISTRFAEFAKDLRFEDQSKEMVFQCKKVVLDLVGVALAGYAIKSEGQSSTGLARG